MTDRPTYPPASLGSGGASSLADATPRGLIRSIADTINRILQGKQNVILEVTLADGVGQTVVQDARISAFSSFHWQPLTAHAAAAVWATPYILVSDQKDGEATFDHVSDADTDKTFNLLIIG